VSHYDSFDYGPKLTPEEIQKRKKAIQEQEVTNWNSAISELRNILTNGEIKSFGPSDIMALRAEVEARSNTHLGQAVWNTLQQRGELSPDGLTPRKAVEPDPAYLSYFQLAPVPLDSLATITNSPLNNLRSRRVAGFVQQVLDAGDTIVVRKKDGTFEEVIFTYDPIEKDR